MVNLKVHRLMKMTKSAKTGPTAHGRIEVSSTWLGISRWIEDYIYEYCPFSCATVASVSILVNAHQLSNSNRIIVCYSELRTGIVFFNSFDTNLQQSDTRTVGAQYLHPIKAHCCLSPSTQDLLCSYGIRHDTFYQAPCSRRWRL
jgi:hypothetical protein